MLCACLIISDALLLVFCSSILQIPNLHYKEDQKLLPKLWQCWCFLLEWIGWSLHYLPRIVKNVNNFETFLNWNCAYSFTLFSSGRLREVGLVTLEHFSVSDLQLFSDLLVFEFLPKLEAFSSFAEITDSLSSASSFCTAMLELIAGETKIVERSAMIASGSNSTLLALLCRLQ